MRELFLRMVVAVDGSPAAMEAVRAAASLARDHEADVSGIFVVDDGALEDVARTARVSPGDLRHTFEENGWRYLDEAARVAKEYGVTLHRELRHGVAHNEILDVAADRDATLIVMGKVSRKGVRRLLVGVITERVLEYAECPVLIVKAEE